MASPKPHPPTLVALICGKREGLGEGPWPSPKPHPLTLAELYHISSTAGLDAGCARWNCGIQLAYSPA